MSLRLRLSLIFGVGTAALIVISGIVFLGQLRSSLNAAIDATLRDRSVAVADALRSGHAVGSLPVIRQGRQQTGQHSGGDEFVQVLAPSGTVISPDTPEEPSVVLSRAELRQTAQRPVIAMTTVEGERARILAKQVQTDSRRVIVVVGVTTTVADAAQSRARLIILGGGPLAVLAAGLGAWLLTGAALSPVERMRRRLDQITEHDISARLRVPHTKDEIAALAATTNRLLGRLQEALARQRGFVADAGHELRTPLTSLKAELELAARPGKSQHALASAVAAAAGDTDRLIRMAEDLLLLARADEGTALAASELIDICEVMDSSAQSFAAQADAHSIAISARNSQELIICADPDKLRQALANLIDNAIRHSPDGGVIEVSADLRPDSLVVIEVRDHGPGFPVEFLPHAFERFRRANPARNRADGGAGLGLAIVASIAAAHGGRAIADNHPAGGARVRIEIPGRPR
jgi:two-component system, OmpR family, sensor kinase